VEEVATVGAAVEKETIATTVVMTEATMTAGTIVTEMTEIVVTDVTILVIAFEDVMTGTEALYIGIEAIAIEETHEMVEHAR